MQTPTPHVGPVQLDPHRPAHNLQSVAEAGDQPIQHLVTHLDPSGQELADAGLPHAADARQFRLGHFCLRHHLSQ